jgi:UDP-N-acetylmuramoyl-L-alanyl-D-glutamate--2,6-diaminopimelate ligase
MERATLGDLFRTLPQIRVPEEHAGITVTAVCDRSADVMPGALFIAVPGMAADGAAYAPDAAARGAAAIVSEVPLDIDVPVIRVPDARAALAGLAAAAYGEPARRLRLVGITGTIGKTSVLAMLTAILEQANIPAGAIGSLGVSYRGREHDTGNTTPGVLMIQRMLADMVAHGVSVAAMEVTSHALVQQRVRGLVFDLGIFTNLTMLEHMEYHDSFADYAAAKLRFLDHLADDAPLVHSAGDRVVRQAVRRHGGPRISCGGGAAWVNVRRETVTLHGSRVRLRVRRPLPLLDGTCLEPCDIVLDLATPGRANTNNAALAAVAALCLGAPAHAVRAGLAAIEPPRRRLQVIRDRDPIVIDDTVGHPDSISAVFELVARIPHARVRAVFCIRGRRGAEINERDAEALAIWARQARSDGLYITSGVDSADERNIVSPAERDAFLGMLTRRRIRFTHHDRLRDAIPAALAGIGRRDVVLLLGAQGMDAGAAILRQHCATLPDGCRPPQY